jgi:hypothetical protein
MRALEEVGAGSILEQTFFTRVLDVEIYNSLRRDLSTSRSSTREGELQRDHTALSETDTKHIHTTPRMSFSIFI